MLKKILSIGLLLSFVPGIDARCQQDTTVYTLSQCIKIALKNNFTVKQKEWQNETDRQSWKLAQGGILPTLNGDIFHAIKEGRSIDPYTNTYLDQKIGTAYYNLSTNLLLWNGGNIVNTAKQYHQNYRASEMDVQQSIDLLTVNMILLYTQILSYQEQSIQANNQYVVTHGELNRLTLLYNNDATSLSALSDIKGQLANDQLNIINVNNSLEASKVALCQLLNFDIKLPFKLALLADAGADNMISETEDQIYEIACKQLAIVKAADFRLESANRKLLAAKASRMPTIYLTGSIGTNYSSAASVKHAISTMDYLSSNYVLSGSGKNFVYTPETSYSSSNIPYATQWQNNYNSLIGLDLQIPLLNGTQVKRKIELARIYKEQETFEADYVRRQLKESVKLAYLNMTSANERYAQLSEQVNYFSESFNAAEIKFKNGASATVEYMVAKNNLDKANSNLIAAKYDLILRKKILDVYMGRLTY